MHGQAARVLEWPLFLEKESYESSVFHEKHSQQIQIVNTFSHNTF
jgi:hypothetical protein